MLGENRALTRVVAHAREAPLGVGPLVDRLVRLLDRDRELAAATGDVGVRALLVAVHERLILERARDRVDREAAGDVAARVAAHAVRHGEQVVLVQAEVAVLVLLALLAGIRLPDGADEQQRRRAGRLVDGRLVVVDDGDGGRLLALVPVVIIVVVVIVAAVGRDARALDRALQHLRRRQRDQREVVVIVVERVIVVVAAR